MLINHNIFGLPSSDNSNPNKRAKINNEKGSISSRTKTNLWKGWKSLKICLDNNQTINICCLVASHVWVCWRQQQQKQRSLIHWFHPSLFTHYHKIFITLPVLFAYQKFNNLFPTTAFFMFKHRRERQQTISQINSLFFTSIARLFSVCLCRGIFPPQRKLPTLRNRK